MSADGSGDAIAVLLHPGERRRLGACEREALRAALIVASALDVPAIAIGAGAAAELDPALTLALRAGCARAIRVEPPASPDYLSLASRLADAARAVAPRWIVCGERSETGGRGAVGPAVAELLEWPHVSAVVELAVRGEELELRCALGGQLRRLAAAAPALVCVRSAGAAAPRMAGSRAAPQRRSIREADEAALAPPGERAELPHPRRAVILDSPAALIQRLRGDHLIADDLPDQ